MHVLPLQPVLRLRLAFVSPVTYGEDTETVHILRDVEDATDHSVGTRPVVQAPTAHLDPTGTQS